MAFCVVQLSLAVGDELDIEYEVDGWYHVRGVLGSHMLVGKDTYTLQKRV